MVSLLHPAMMHGSFCGHLATGQHVERGSSQKTQKRWSAEVLIWCPVFPSLVFLMCEIINSLTCYKATLN